MQEHLAEARSALATDSEAAIRRLLEQLGDPSEIAAEARDRFGIGPASSSAPWLEIAALVVLVVPFVGWLASLLMLWLSHVWNRRDKVIGTAFSPVTGGIVLLLALVIPPLGERMAFIVPGFLLAAILTVVYLAVRLVLGSREVAQAH